MAEPFRIGFVPGVAPDKWLRTWVARRPDPIEAHPVEDSAQTAVLSSAAADMCLLRLPVDRPGLHVIPLYVEVPVVVAAADHPVAAFEEVDVADLAEEHLLQDPAAVPEWAALAREVREGTRAPGPPLPLRQAIEVAATGAGIVIVPLSLARLHHRRDLVHRPVTGVAGSRVGLAWLEGNDDPRIEAFIGIVRGRTERSSRGAAPAAEPAARQPRPDRPRPTRRRRPPR